MISGEVQAEAGFPKPTLPEDNRSSAKGNPTPYKPRRIKLHARQFGPSSGCVGIDGASGLYPFKHLVRIG